MAETEHQPLTLPIVWVGIEDLPEHSVNQLIVQHAAPNEFVLTFGHVVLPVILGTPQQREAAAQDIRYVTVKPTVRLGMNRARLKEFLTVLQENLANHDKQFGISDE